MCYINMIFSSERVGFVQIMAIQCILFYLMRTHTIIAGIFRSIPTIFFTESKYLLRSRCFYRCQKSIDGELFLLVFIVYTGTLLDHGNGIQSEAFYCNELRGIGEPCVNRILSAWWSVDWAVFRCLIMTQCPS